MSVWRQLRHGLRALLHPRQADEDVAEELRFYLDQAAAAHRARGLSSADAARAARLEIGSPTIAREQVRTSGWEHVAETVALDLRHALRGLRKSPGFTATAVVTLAVGLGASTAVFSAVSPVLLEPLPFPHARRLVALDDRNSAGDPLPATLGTYDEVRARSHSFEALAAADQWQPSVTGNGDPERLEGQRVTASYFPVFGAVPLIGRTFDAHDDEPGASSVVILANGLWQRRFGGDRSIVGRSIELNGRAYLVIGVMPRTFANVIAPSVEIWTPMQARATADFNSREWGHHYRIVGRLAPNATVGDATREIQRIGESPVAEFPRPRWANLNHGLVVQSLQNDITGDIRPALFAVAAAVLVLLAIASVNVANLLLARSARRRAEFAMRMALGADRGRLLRQLLTESLVLAAVGGALGYGVARVGVRALVAASPPDLPRVDAIRLDARVFMFTVALTMFIGVIVGLVPALGATRAGVSAGLERGVRRTTTGRGAGRGTLVVAEVALALILLVSAGLLLRSVRRLVAVAPGFEPAHVVTMQVVATAPSYRSDSARLRFFGQALDAVRGVPGVTNAAFTSQLPLSGDVDGYGYTWQFHPQAKDGEDGSAFRYAVTPGYFATMRIPLRRGRLIGAMDRPGAPEAIVINESFARRVFGNRNLLGERLRIGPEIGSGRAWDEVVGVVGDVKQESLALAAPDAFYVASAQWWWVDNVQSLVVRTAGPAAMLVPSIKRAIWSVNANQPIVRVATMDSFIAASAGQRRFALVAIEAFAVAALLLATVGLYGVIAVSVTERVREIGIRIALGATPSAIVGGVVGRALALTLTGGVLGLVGAFAASSLLASMLFGVSRSDPVTYGLVIVLFAGVALVAAWVPARRAAAVDPTIALRAE